MTMLNQIKVLAVKLIDRYYLLKSNVNLNESSYKKNALVSYVLVPKRYLGFYYKTSHNNRVQCYLLIKYLKKQGYNIYLHSYLDIDGIDYSIDYDLFIGHNLSFSAIASKLKEGCKKILIVTGSEPNFGNNQQKLRIESVNMRKQTNQFVYEGNIVPDLGPNYRVANSILMLGNEFVKCTYPSEYHHKIKLINNITLHPYFEYSQRERTNNFLFISSVGQVHRGLDLILDVFSKKSIKVYILSSFSDEPEFVELYFNELYNKPNIIPVGYLPLNSKKFKDIIDDIDFVILPSCSEGQSSSVINTMAYGKIPVVPENVGITDIENIGVKINSIDIEGVQEAVIKAIALTDEEFNEKKQKVAQHNHLYLPAAFESSLNVIDL